jgi:RND family efflux transporter MFP subunit
MNDMNLETPIRTSDSETVVVVDDRARRRRRIAIIGAALVAIVAIILAMTMMGGEETPAGGANGQQAEAPTVTVVIPGRQQVARTINATGTIAARVDMPVGIAGEGGSVVQVLVQPGDWVRAGQTLAVIDRSVQSQEAAQLAAQVQAARADAALAQNELERSEALVGRGFVSKADVDRKRAARDAAAARVRVSQAQLGATRARIGRLSVRSPAAGLVLDRNVEPGQVVSAGSGALFRVARGGEMELLAQVSEADLAQLRVGVPATVIPVGTDQRITGSVWQVSPIINEQNRQGIARVAVPYSPALRPGGFANVSITSGSQQAPVLPESAILSDDEGTYVYVVGKNNKVERRAVTIGTVTPAGIAIVQGLSGQEPVVLRAGGFLTPGQTVRPKRQAR